MLNFLTEEELDKVKERLLKLIISHQVSAFTQIENFLENTEEEITEEHFKAFRALCIKNIYDKDKFEKSKKDAENFLKYIFEDIDI